MAALIAAILAFKRQGRQLEKLEEQAADQHKFNEHQSKVLDDQAEQQGEQLKLLREQVADQLAFNQRQSKVIDLQAEELQAARAIREQDAEDRRRRQASRVFFEGDIGLGIVMFVGQDLDNEPRYYEAKIANQSDLPIYDVRVRWHQGSAAWQSTDGEIEDHWERLMPGKSNSVSRQLPNHAKTGYDAVVEFRDAAGWVWRRDRDGQLDEVSGPSRPDNALEQPNGGGAG